LFPFLSRLHFNIRCTAEAFSREDRLFEALLSAVKSLWMTPMMLSKVQVLFSTPMLKFPVLFNALLPVIGIMLLYKLFILAFKVVMLSYYIISRSHLLGQHAQKKSCFCICFQLFFPYTIAGQ
jgi:hypothetical protein